MGWFWSLLASFLGAGRARGEGEKRGKRISLKDNFLSREMIFFFFIEIERKLVLVLVLLCEREREVVINN